jgi:hypothetical protein
VDPLLLLISELKKAENEIRSEMHSTPAAVKPVKKEENPGGEE